MSVKKSFKTKLIRLNKIETDRDFQCCLFTLIFNVEVGGLIEEPTDLKRHAFRQPTIIYLKARS